MPLFVTDSAVFIVSTRQDWNIISLEVSDGFYHPVCAITRVVLDHFNVAALESFAVVGLTYAIYWAPFISGDCPTPLPSCFLIVTFHAFFHPDFFTFESPCLVNIAILEVIWPGKHFVTCRVTSHGTGGGVPTFAFDALFSSLITYIPTVYHLERTAPTSSCSFFLSLLT